MSRLNWVLSATAVIALLASGCSAGTRAPPQSAYQQGMEARTGAGQARACPMAVPDTALTISEMPDGIALTFTTETGDVNDLRARVRQAAEEYRAAAEQPGMQGAMPGRGPAGHGEVFRGDIDQQGMGGQSGFGSAGPRSGPGVTTPAEPGSITGRSPTASNQPQMGTSGGADSSHVNPPPALDYRQGVPLAQQERGAIRVPYRVYAEDIDRGARLVFTPRDPAQIEALRTEVRQHAALMLPGECPPPRISRR